MKNNCLVINFDPDDSSMIITKSKDALSFEIVNELYDKEAEEVYNILIGNIKKCCENCKYHIYGRDHRCNHQDHFGDYIQPYTVCDDYEVKPPKRKKGN